MMKRKTAAAVAVLAAVACHAFNLGVSNSGKAGDYTDCEFRMTYGYRFTAVQGKSLSLKADKEYCYHSADAVLSGGGQSQNASQTGSSQNYISCVTPLDCVSDVSFSGANAFALWSQPARLVNTVDYYDGMGRKERTVQRRVTPSGADIVTGVGYDPYGRENRQSLPTPVEAGTFPSDPFATAAEYHSDQYAYTETLLDSSPLDRVTGRRKAGEGYHQHPSKTAYKTNGSNVRLLQVKDGVLTAQSCYPAGKLYAVESTDEDGHRSEEYKDIDGRLVLSRRYGMGGTLDTYYVYDEKGRLSYVLPPLATDACPGSGTVSDDAEFMKQYAYLYKYDDRGDCTEKRLPGCEPVKMAYDKFHRLVLSQDGNQRADSTATATAYDKFGRIAYTAVKEGVTDFDALREGYASKGVNETLGTSADPVGGGYTVKTHTGLTRTLTVKYYDNYNFINSLSYGERIVLRYSEMSGYDTKWTSAMGRVTGERVYTLTGDGEYVVKAYYYDSWGRTVQQCETNLLGGYDKSYYKYSYSGKVLKQLRQHTDNANSFNETYTYAYDHSDRVTSVRYKLGQRDEITLVSYTYDELGRIKQKKSYDKNLGVTNYAYNIQDQITVIDANYYDKHYHYADLSESGHKALYNGDISSCVTLAGKNVIDSVRYTYDDLDRITAETGMTGPDGSLSAMWDYDKHTNITGLRRTDKNGVQIDDLDITYTGNQIDKVDDYGYDADRYNTIEYIDRSVDLERYGGIIVGAVPENQQSELSKEHQYDANGNMTVDLDRKIVASRYNLLNLPDTIQYFDGAVTVNRYLADGTKVSSHHYTPKATTMVPIGKVCDVESLGEVRLSGTAYCGNIEYDTDSNGTPTLKRVFNSEGFVTNCNTNGIPVYISRDIQGSLLSAWTLNGYYPIQYADYYADGLIKDNSSGYNAQPHFYNFKELVKMHGYDCYDYGARHSYTALGRFTTIDPLAEKYYGISPYALCAGNPVRYVDFDGRDYNLTFDADTVTISATYYTATDDATASAKNGAAIINGQSGDFIYDTKDAGSYIVNFDLQVEQVPNDGSKKETSVLNPHIKDSDSNAYIISSDFLSDNVNGTTDKNFIKVRPSQKMSLTGAHEMGHSIGLIHMDTGLMTPASSDPNRSPSLTRSGVRDVISYGIKGKRINEAAGLGNLVNKTQYNTKQLSHGKIKRVH